MCDSIIFAIKRVWYKIRHYHVLATIDIDASQSPYTLFSEDDTL